MKLELIRQVFTNDFTLGELLMDGVHFCYTVEDAVRPTGEKIFGKTAIPYGSYEVKMTMSNRFKVMMPLLCNVPNFEGVRIHSGNTSADTDGCLIVGNIRTKDGVAESRKACALLYDHIEQSDSAVSITISQGALA
jgi:Family of unknown function (DUF5675)